MTIQLIRDENFKVDFDKLKRLIESKCKTLKIEILENKYHLKESLIVFRQTHVKLRKEFEKRIKSDIVILATDVSYANDYFFEEYEGFFPISFYGWESLTEFPRESGMLYWICDIVLGTLQTNATEHMEVTGCINDFLWDKTGIDEGIRQAHLCPKCLTKLLKKKFNAEEKKLFDDVKVLLNYLSEKSKWGLSIFDGMDAAVPKNSKTKKLINKAPKKKKSIAGTKFKVPTDKIIKVMIASPSDTEQEREVLCWRLAEKFRLDGFEKQTGYRIIVEGWEQLASQPGRAQNVINRLIVSQVNIILGVLRHRMGTPTQNALSGTAEEILYALDKHPDKVLGMVYFYSKKLKVTAGPDAANALAQWETKEKFKKSIEGKIIYKPYDSATELLNVCVLDIAQNINNYFKP